MKLAPIALFVYNRPEHTRQTVEALLKNELASESDLFIFSDAEKKFDAAAAVKEVREYIKTITGFKSISIVERNRNWGLANSVIDGVTKVVNEYGRIIVLEDDLIVQPSFLSYMNNALGVYENNSQVMQVSGYMFPVVFSLEEDALFLPFTTSWGWATWRRAWESFDPLAKEFELLKKNKLRKKAFNLDNSYPYFEMLKSQMRGDIDSWAIRWYLSVFVNNGLVLYPKTTLVHNAGFDGSGTHYDVVLDQKIDLNNFEVHSFPSKVHIKPDCKKIIFEFFYKKKRNRLIQSLSSGRCILRRIFGAMVLK